MRPITRYDSLPDDIYTSAYNKDSLIELKRMIKDLQSPSIDTSVASEYQRRLRTAFIKYRYSFEKEKPFTYFLKTPLKIMSSNAVRRLKQEAILTEVNQFHF